MKPVGAQTQLPLRKSWEAVNFGAQDGVEILVQEDPVAGWGGKVGDGLQVCGARFEEGDLVAEEGRDPAVVETEHSVLAVAGYLENCFAGLGLDVHDVECRGSVFG